MKKKEKDRKNRFKGKNTIGITTWHLWTGTKNTNKKIYKKNKKILMIS